MTKKIIYSLLFILGISHFTSAQFGFSHEVGAFVGPVAFQSDFGERRDLSTNAGNTGFGVGLVHYMNFSYRAECNCYTPETYFNDHFKLRTEFSYTKTKLDHFGEYADKQNNAASAQLRAMDGEVKVTDVGMQLEYFPWSIREFTATNGAWAPFVGLGAHFNLYKPDVFTTTGNGKVSALTMPNWPKYYDGGVNTDGGSTWSIVSSVGSRYKLSELSDLFVELRWQYYFSNWVDGVSPDPKRFPENKSNDWNVWVNFGYIYYLD